MATSASAGSVPVPGTQAGVIGTHKMPTVSRPPPAKVDFNVADPKLGNFIKAWFKQKRIEQATLEQVLSCVNADDEAQSHLTGQYGARIDAQQLRLFFRRPAQESRFVVNDKGPTTTIKCIGVTAKGKDAKNTQDPLLLRDPSNAGDDADSNDVPSPVDGNEANFYKRQLEERAVHFILAIFCAREAGCIPFSNFHKWIQNSGDPALTAFIGPSPKEQLTFFQARTHIFMLHNGHVYIQASSLTKLIYLLNAHIYKHQSCAFKDVFQSVYLQSRRVSDDARELVGTQQSDFLEFLKKHSKIFTLSFGDTQVSTTRLLVPIDWAQARAFHLPFEVSKFVQFSELHEASGQAFMPNLDGTPLGDSENGAAGGGEEEEQRQQNGSHHGDDANAEGAEDDVTGFVPVTKKKPPKTPFEREQAKVAAAIAAADAKKMKKLKRREKKEDERPGEEHTFPMASSTPKRAPFTSQFPPSTVSAAVLNFERNLPPRFRKTPPPQSRDQSRTVSGATPSSELSGDNERNSSQAYEDDIEDFFDGLEFDSEEEELDAGQVRQPEEVAPGPNGIEGDHDLEDEELAADAAAVLQNSRQAVLGARRHPLSDLDGFDDESPPGFPNEPPPGFVHGVPPGLNRSFQNFSEQPHAVTNNGMHAVHSLPQLPVHPFAVPPNAAVVGANVGAAQHAAAPPVVQIDENAAKSANFFQTLIRMAKTNNGTVHNAKSLQLTRLIQNLVDGRLTAAEFVDTVQRLLNSAPQPHLSGFLQGALANLRVGLSAGKLRIDGIVPPSSNVLQPAQVSVAQPPPPLAIVLQPNGAHNPVESVTLEPAKATPLPSSANALLLDVPTVARMPSESTNATTQALAEGVVESILHSPAAPPSFVVSASADLRSPAVSSTQEELNRDLLSTRDGSRERDADAASNDALSSVSGRDGGGADFASAKSRLSSPRADGKSTPTSWEDYFETASERSDSPWEKDPSKQGSLVVETSLARESAPDGTVDALLTPIATVQPSPPAQQSSSLAAGKTKQKSAGSQSTGQQRGQQVAGTAVATQVEVTFQCVSTQTPATAGDYLLSLREFVTELGVMANGQYSFK